MTVFADGIWTSFIFKGKCIKTQITAEIKQEDKTGYIFKHY